MARFFKLSRETSDLLINARLTAAEWRLWVYLISLDPFGDSYLDLPDTITIFEKCRLSKATFYRAIAKFQELELFDFQDKGFSFRNLQGSQKRESCLKNETGSLKNETENLKNATGSLKNETENLKNATATIYTDFQTLSDESEPANQIFKDSHDGQEEAIAVLIKNDLELEKEKGSEARTNKVRQCSFNWLPEGPWAIAGKLDPNFRDWLAHAWLSQFGGDIHQRQADVLAHFKKDPANLPIRWEQYQSEFLHRFENAQILIDNGVAIPETSQAKLIANQRAITQSLPQEMNPCAQRALGIASITPATVEPLPLTQGIVQSVEPQEPPQAHRFADICEIAPTYVPIPENGENSQAYKLWKAPKPVEAPITPEQWEATKERLAALTGKFNFGKSSPRQNSPSNSLESLNQQLHDPALREAAIAFAKNSPDFKYCPDSNEIITCEEF